jgi:hypothetical protein
MADSKATSNADGLTNAQGEFNPKVPRSQPLTTSGHQVGQKVSPADHAPEFSAKTLPAGTAPKENTFTPRPTNEVPGQADNPDSTERSDPLDFPGSTSKDVHTGLGHPGQGQTSTELRNEGQHTSKKVGAGLEGAGADGGTGLQGGGMNKEFEKLARDTHEGQHGPVAERDRDGGTVPRLDGAKTKEPVKDTEL